MERLRWWRGGGAVLLLSLCCAAALVAATDTYMDCVADDVFGFPLLCLNAEFADDCSVHIQVSATNSSAPVLDGTLNLEQSRAICSSYNACELCAQVDDFSVDVETGVASGCFTVITRDCLIASMDNEQQLDCFCFDNAASANCLACPADCGGPERGTCSDGHCECEEGWLPPICTVEDVEPAPAPPPVHSDTSQCVNIGNPLNVELCAEMWIHDCDAYLNITLNGREIANTTVDLIREEELQQPQCTELFTGCEGCILVENFTLEYSEDLQANYFNVCSSLRLDDDCFAVLDAEDLQLPLGCTQFLASDCHFCETDCNGNGDCVEGICECYDGYRGFECEYNLCPNNCSGNGDCYDGVCDCYDMYLGDDCSEHCMQAVTGIHIVSQKWYNNEEAGGLQGSSGGGEEDGEGEEREEESEGENDGESEGEIEGESGVWRGWMEVGHNTAGISLGIGAGVTNETTAIAVVVRKDCPPTNDVFDFSFVVELTDNSGDAVGAEEEWHQLFDDCSMREPHGSWFFAVYCIQGTACPFRFNAWVTAITMATPGVKLFGSVQPPHKAYHVLSLASSSAVDLLLKVKLAGEPGADALRLHGRFEDCPTLTEDDDEFVLSTPEPVESTLYAYGYSGHFLSEEAGTWYFAIVPTNDCGPGESCAAVQYSLLADAEFVCIPPCLNGGTCSQLLENTCICNDNGYTGRRCEETECVPACEHGKCVGANECECDEGWMGPTCIDIDHQHSPVPFGHFAGSTPASTYAIILLIVVLLLVTVAFVAVFTLSCSEDSFVGSIRLKLLSAAHTA